MPAENEVNITLTDVYNKQLEQGEKYLTMMGDIKTSIAVLAESVKPQGGINTELFRRVLAVEKLAESIKPQGTDIAAMKIDLDTVKKKVWQLPSIATLISIGGLIVAILAMNSR